MGVIMAADVGRKDSENPKGGASSLPHLPFQWPEIPTAGRESGISLGIAVLFDTGGGIVQQLRFDCPFRPAHVVLSLSRRDHS
jgi:hypothetical protein